MKNKLKVINLISGPGTGKSSIAAGLFYLMKIRGYNVELVTEYVKTAAYEKRKSIFDDQVYIFAKQMRRMHILRNEVDWIVTDSPLLLSAIYSPVNYYENFIPLVQEVNNSFDNYNFFIKRTGKYSKVGRNETEEEAKAIDNRVLELLSKNEIPFKVVSRNDAPETILNIIENNEY